jgi:hypothetical protein
MLSSMKFALLVGFFHCALSGNNSRQAWAGIVAGFVVCFVGFRGGAGIWGLTGCLVGLSVAVSCFLVGAGAIEGCFLRCAFSARLHSLRKNELFLCCLVCPLIFCGSESVVMPFV